ncbi:MAG: helix-turn-helix domain-containing protein [bacterium]|nr:helix-turn-helix domain-containing protein [bacterium]
MSETRRKTRRMIVREASHRLRKVRGELNLSRIELSARLGVGSNAYGKSEAGVNLLSLPNLLFLQNNYDISMDWLLFGRGPMHYRTKIEEAGLETERERLKKEEERLKKEAQRLKKEAERVKESGESAAKFVELETVMPDITELLEHMAKDPQLRYTTLLNFYNYQKEKTGGQSGDGG